MALFKAQATMREVKQRLTLQMPASGTKAVTFTDSSSANSVDQPSYPDLLIQLLQGSDPNEVMWLRIEDEGNAGRVDAIGMPQRVYSPHKAIVIFGSTEVGASADQLAAAREVRGRLLAAAGKMGMKIEVWVAPADFETPISTTYATAKAAASLSYTIKSDEIHPLTMSQ